MYYDILDISLSNLTKNVILVNEYKTYTCFSFYKHEVYKHG